MQFLLTAIFIIMAALAGAQDLALRSFNVEQGLSSSESYHVFQDSKGYIWVGTDAGVSKFDGYRFENYTTKNGLADNTIFGIYEDHRSRIWFRSYSGRLSYYLNGKFYSIGANDSIVKNIEANILSSIYVDEGDTLWCGISGGKGYFKILPGFEQKDFKQVFIREQLPYLIKFKSGVVYGNVWNQNYLVTNKFLLIEKQKQTYIELPAPLDVSTYRAYKNADKIVIIEKGMLYQLKNNRLEVIYKSDDKIFVYAYTDRNHHFWAGSRIDKGIIYISDEDTISFMKNTSVSSVMQDHEGGYWFSTLNRGLYYVPTLAFKRYEFGDEQYPLKLQDIHEVDSVTLLVRFVNQQAAIIKNRELQKVYPSLISVLGGPDPLTNVSSLQMAANIFYDNYSRDKENLLLYMMFLKFCDKDETGFFGARIDTTYFLNHQKRKIIRLFKNPSRVNCLHYDKKTGVLYLGCVNGLWTYENGRLHFLGDRNSLFKQRIEDIVPVEGNRLLIAVKGLGLILYNYSDTKLIRQKDGLVSEICKDLYRSSDTIVWVSTNAGTSRVFIKGDKIRINNFTVADGMLSNEIRKIIELNDLIWMATSRGLCSFDYKNYARYTSTIPMYLTQVLINKKKVALNDRNIQLAYDENFIEFDFVGLSYKKSNNLVYYYKLEGLNTDWQQTTDLSVQYTTLPPGKYNFIVYAKSQSDDSYCKPVQFSFVIHKPWYLTFWFAGLHVFLLLLLIGIFIYSRINRVKRTERERGRINQEMHELEMKALRSQMNPHFLFNAINSIQNFVIKNDSKSAQKYLTKFARLIRLVLENSKSEFIPLRQEIDTVSLYIDLEALRASHQFEYIFHIDENINTDLIKIQPLLLQPYVENAIMHGLRPLRGRKGLLEITIKRQNDMLVCEIRDNGIGREKARKNVMHRDPLHTSTGMNVTRQRIEILNKTRDANATVEIIDNYTEDHLPAGTTVFLTLPVII